MAGASKKSYKHKNGKQVSYYTATYRDMYGKQHTVGRFKTRAEARKHGLKLEESSPDITNVTFEQVFKCYINIALPKYSHTTKETYELYIDNHLSKLYPLKYDKVSSIALQKFIDDIEQGYTPFVAQLCLKIARAVCNFAIKHKLIKENKFNAVDNVVVSPQDKHHLTEAEEREIAQYCEKLYPKYYAMLYTLMGTGMRIGELLAIEVADINYNNKSIRVNKQFTKGKFKDGTKNRAKRVSVLERDVYLTNDVIEVLKRHIKSLPEDTKLLFPSQVNGYINVDNFRRRVWQPLLTYADITDRVRIHDLRGSYADIAETKGASLKFIQNQLGHTKAQTTLDVYMKNSQDMINDALEKMNGTLR
ncbi:MAG: site-specific integrase [Candidatus Gastranaerophilales bacterium]|nr:site-specific integrase [Candidatus Gastranaerophilales bacterium]MCM1338184.1 site-specific integrase [Muribaculaceae bacterium]